MDRSLKYHVLYKTVCNVTGNFYIGAHSTMNLEDDYFGSGLRICNSLHKYGKENHTKEFLEFFDSREKLLEREKEVVNRNLLSEEKCLNLKIGGEGGLSSEEHASKYYEAGRRALLDRMKKDATFASHVTSEARKKFSEKRRNGEIHMSFSEAARLGRSKRMGTMLSKTWSGKIWVHHDESKTTTRIEESNFSVWESTGWKRGRKMKYGPVAQLVQSITLTK